MFRKKTCSAAASFSNNFSFFCCSGQFIPLWLSDLRRRSRESVISNQIREVPGACEAHVCSIKISAFLQAKPSRNRFSRSSSHLLIYISIIILVYAHKYYQKHIIICEVVENHVDYFESGVMSDITLDDLASCLINCFISVINPKQHRYHSILGQLSFLPFALQLAIVYSLSLEFQDQLPSGTLFSTYSSSKSVELIQ